MTEQRTPSDTPLPDKPPSPDNNQRPDEGVRNAKYKVFVGGIARTADEAELFTIFRKYSPKEVLIMREMATQRSRGFGFITFATQKDMEWAIDEMHNSKIHGKVVTVSKARPFDQQQRGRYIPRSASPDKRYYASRDYKRYDDRDNGHRYDSRRHAYPPRRYPRDARASPDPPYHSYYRHDRGDYHDYDTRRGYGGPSGGRYDDYHRGDSGRGQYMDYERRQQIRDQEARRYNTERRYNSGRYRSPDLDRPIRMDPESNGHYGQSRRHSEVTRVPPPYRHRSRSLERGGR